MGASYAGHDIDTIRTITFPAFSDQTSASYDGATLQAFGEIGYAVRMASLRFEPFLGASILGQQTDGFQENGGVAALTGYSRTQELGTTTLGLRTEATFGEAAEFTLHGTLGWRHAYGDLAPTSLVAFDGGAAPFVVFGLPFDRDALIARAGLDWQATRGVTLGVSYNGQIGKRGQDNTLNGNLTWRF
jgi:outer membrane autotransporter protein